MIMGIGISVFHFFNEVPVLFDCIQIYQDAPV